jgi:hypothetical protein
MPPLKVDYNDYPALTGKRLRVVRGNFDETGLLEGLGESIVATGPTTTARSWRLKTDKGNVVEFVPMGCEIFDASDSFFTD